MTTRRWGWAAATAVIGAILLATGIHARATWHQPKGSVESLTLDQLMGMVVGTLLLAVAVTMVVSGLRTQRGRRRLPRR